MIVKKKRGRCHECFHESTISIVECNEPRGFLFNNMYGCRVIHCITVTFLNFLKFLLFENPNTTKLVLSIAGANLQNDFARS